MRLSLIALALILAACGSPTSPDSQPPPNTPQTHVIGPPPTASTVLTGTWYSSDDKLTLTSGWIGNDYDPHAQSSTLVQADVRVKSTRVWFKAEHVPFRDCLATFDGAFVADSIAGWCEMQLLEYDAQRGYYYAPRDTVFMSFHRKF